MPEKYATMLNHLRNDARKIKESTMEYTFTSSFKFESVVCSDTGRELHVDTLEEALEALETHVRLWSDVDVYEFVAKAIDEFTPSNVVEVEKVREFNRYMSAKGIAAHVYATFLPI